jgi:hypothetical protein
MKLIIKEKSKSQLREAYAIEVDFMFGDTDGDETLTFEFSKAEYANSDFAEEVHSFIRSILEAINVDYNGRGGFESSKECIKWYGLGQDYMWKNNKLVNAKAHEPVYQWNRFCDDGYDIDEPEVQNVSESGKFLYSIPTYSDGWYASYENISISYYDEQGYKYLVEIDEEN